MSFLAHLLKEPPPAYVFELSEAGLAFSKTGAAPRIEFEPFPPGVLTVSPLHDNVQQPEALRGRIAAMAPEGNKTRRPAALILPDYSARITVLDFDSFPASAEEQLALIQFRMRKTLPFDVESAMMGYYAQPRRERSAVESGKIEVLTAVMATEIVSRYEAPFRDAGFAPGLVTTSSLAAMNLISPGGVTLSVKLTGLTLSVTVLYESAVKLMRCVEIADTTQDEIESVILPTMAYIEDELSAKPKRLLLCGLGLSGERMAQDWAASWGVEVETVRSRYGVPGPSNAGLLGYLESLA